MYGLVCFALLTLLSAGVSARSTPLSLKGGDPLEVINEIIYEANQKTAKENKSVMALPQGLDVGLFLYRLRATNVTVGRLDTLALRGNRQNLTETDLEDSSILDVDITVGLDVLELEADVQYRLLLFGSHGRLKVSVSGEQLRVVMTITTRNDGTCSAVLKSAVLEDLGELKVDMSPGLMNWFTKHLLQLLGSHVLPHFRGIINKELAEAVRTQVPSSDFEKTVCQPFVI